MEMVRILLVWETLPARSCGRRSGSSHLPCEQSRTARAGREERGPTRGPAAAPRREGVIERLTGTGGRQDSRKRCVGCRG